VKLVKLESEPELKATCLRHTATAFLM